MPDAVTLTAHEKRQLRDYLPSLSNRDPGADLVTILENLGKIITGQATVLDGNTSVAVTVPEGYEGNPVIVCFAEGPTAADLDVWGAVSGTTLTITTSADNTADLLVNYLIDGRT